MVFQQIATGAVGTTHEDTTRPSGRPRRDLPAWQNARYETARLERVIERAKKAGALAAVDQADRVWAIHGDVKSALRILAKAGFEP